MASSRPRVRSGHKWASLLSRTLEILHSGGQFRKERRHTVSCKSSLRPPTIFQVRIPRYQSHSWASWARTHQKPSFCTRKESSFEGWDLGLGDVGVSRQYPWTKTIYFAEACFYSYGGLAAPICNIVGRESTDCERARCSALGFEARKLKAFVTLVKVNYFGASSPTRLQHTGRCQLPIRNRTSSTCTLGCSPVYILTVLWTDCTRGYYVPS